MVTTKLLVRTLAVCLVAVGAILNEFSVAYWLSSDGVLENITIQKVRVFNIITISLGCYLFISKRATAIVGSLIQKISDCKRLIYVVLVTILYSLITIQGLSIVESAYRNSDISSVIHAQDWEPGRHIKIAQEAGWTNFHRDNNYGVLYFRIAHSLASFSPEDNLGSHVSSAYHQEKTHHFYLQVVSIIGLFGISFIIATLISTSPLLRAFIFLALNITLLSNELWVSHIFRAVPDVLLSFFVSLYLVVLLKVKLENCPRISTYSVALISALAIATKTAFAPFLSVAIVVLGYPINRQAMSRLVLFGLTCCFAYFVISFPNSLKIEDAVQNIFVLVDTWMRPATRDSVLTWLILLIRESALGAGVVFFLSLIDSTSKTPNLVSPKRQQLIAISCLVPLILLLNARYISPNHQNNALPYIAMIYVLSGVLGIHVRQLLGRLMLPHVFQMFRYSAIGVIILVIGGLGLIPNIVPRVLNHNLQDRAAIHSGLKAIRGFASIRNDVPKMIVEKYVPIWNWSDERITQRHLSATLEDLESIQPDLIILNRHQLWRIMDGGQPSDFNLVNRKDYKEFRKYYRLFYGNITTTDPFGGQWVVIYEDDHGTQVWEKQGTRFSFLRRLELD
jgi:hypothetical protein